MPSKLLTVVGGSSWPLYVKCIELDIPFVGVPFAYDIDFEYVRLLTQESIAHTGRTYWSSMS